MALKRTNEYFDLIDGAVRSPDLDVAVAALTACRSYIASQAVELKQLRDQQKNHNRQLAERDTVIADLTTRCRVLAEAAVEDEREIEQLRTRLARCAHA